MIQQNLIPARMPDFSGATFAALYRPMELVGGDLYDFIRFKDNRKIGIFISDVSGHGVPAALITSMVKSLLGSAGGFREKPGDMLRYINHGLIGLTNENFLTAFYGIFDARDRSFTYARGAQTFPLLIRGSDITPLKSCGKMLAVLPDIDFEEKKMHLQSGDTVIFYTDGLTEAIDLTGVDFELEMMERVLPDLSGRRINDVVDTLYAELVRFAKTETFNDDICVVGMVVE